MKKILFVTHDDLSGGSAKSLLSQIIFLQKEKRIDPIVITWKENSLSAYLREKGIPCIALKFDFTSVWTRNKFFHLIKRPYYRLLYNKTAYNFLKKKIDFAEISLIVSNSSVIDLGAYLHRKTQIPHIWYLREFGDIDFNILSYVKNLPRYIENNSNGIIAVSEAVALHWAKRGIKREISVINDGVLEREYPQKDLNKDSIIKICMCGRLSPAKGQHIAIKALKKLPQGVLERVHLDFWGKGESEKELKVLVRNERLEKYVSFRGFSLNLDKELENYEVGLTLSKAEAFGRTTVEYMNHGIFVIGTNVGGTPELLQNGKYGILVDWDCPANVADAVVNYCENRNECHTRALFASEYANEKFAVRKNAEQAMAFYERFLK